MPNSSIRFHAAVRQRAAHAPLAGLLAAGLVLIVAAGAVALWNENRAAWRERLLDDGGGDVVDVRPQTIDPANEGRLVRVGAMPSLSAPLVDSELGLKLQALALERHVEMFQWREMRNVDGKVVYSTGWENTPVESRTFRAPEGHANPGSFAIAPQRTDANDVRIGAYTLSPTILRQLAATQPLQLRPEQLAPAQAGRFRVVDGAVTNAADPDRPLVGDLRVSYSIAPLDALTVIGAQRGSRLEPYVSASGNMLLLLAYGAQPAFAVVRPGPSGSEAEIWLLRLAAVIALAIGFAMAVGHTTERGGWREALRKQGASPSGILLAVLTALLLAGVAWIWVRPWVGLGLFAGASVCVLGLQQRLRLAGHEPARTTGLRLAPHGDDAD